MNREIKFRGKRVDNGEWIYGSLVKYWTGTRYCYKIHDGLYEHQVIPETVGQFAGLHDKNGKEIYEGDEIQAEGQIGVVEFKNGAFRVSDTVLDYVVANYKTEVIGNI